MPTFMYVVCIYYHSSTPKGTSTHTEATVIKTYQTDGREVRGMSVRQISEKLRWQSQSCPQVSWNDLLPGEERLPHIQHNYYLL